MKQSCEKCGYAQFPLTKTGKRKLDQSADCTIAEIRIPDCYFDFYGDHPRRRKVRRNAGVKCPSFKPIEKTDQ